jgi:hypothetical protein
MNTQLTVESAWRCAISVYRKSKSKLVENLQKAVIARAQMRFMLSGCFWLGITILHTAAKRT